MRKLHKYLLKISDILWQISIPMQVLIKDLYRFSIGDRKDKPKADN